MEKSLVKTKKLFTPAKLVLAGVFLIFLGGLFIMNAGAAPDVLVPTPIPVSAPNFQNDEPVDSLVPVVDTSNSNTREVVTTSSATISESAPSSTTSGVQGNSALPSRLRISKLGINSNVQYLGLTAGGDMATPKSAVDVGWYKLGTRPGDIGSAVIAGHVNTSYNPHGVFENLNDLIPGDVIEVVSQNGSVLRFAVTYKKLLGYNASAVEVFGSTGERRLNLITCTGKWLPEKKTYSERLVVFAELL